MREASFVVQLLLAVGVVAILGFCVGYLLNAWPGDDDYQGPRPA